ncbi:MAG: DUF4412 domain-containing protein [Bacteroidota bacterium]|nr:DUF4412 domain-containing protein [Bacteroidota bacterium]
MKKSLGKLFSITVLLLAFSVNAVAQSFEGTIEFKKAKASDTTNYVYYVKGNQVRIDEIGSKSRVVEGSFLIDLDTKVMHFLNHERKLYMDQPTPSAPVVKGTCLSKKGQNVKNIQGYKCVEYVVSNSEEGHTVTYFIADGKFNFFDKLLRQLNRKEKSAVYYQKLENVKNSFPMLSIHTDASGKVVERLEVTKLTKKEIDPTLFEIPKGYNKFEK